MLCNYLVTGWSRRFGMWHTESIEASSMEVAKERFVSLRPSLKHIKAYALRGERDLNA